MLKAIQNWYVRLHFERLKPTKADVPLYALLVLFFIYTFIFKFYLNQSQMTLTILHTDSIEGALQSHIVQDGTYTGEFAGGLALFAGKIKQIRRENHSKMAKTLVFDTGNTLFTGNHNPFRQKENARTVIEAMNQIGYNAMTLQSNDFNFGEDFINGLSLTTKFPIVATNYSHPQNHKISRTQIINLGSIKIGVLGLLPPDYHKKSFPNIQEKSEKIEELETETQKAINYFHEENVDITIALSGLKNPLIEKTFMETFHKDINLMLATCLRGIDCKRPQVFNNAPIFRLPLELPQIGRIDLSLNIKSKKIINYEWDFIPITSSTSKPEEKVKKIVNTNISDIEKKLYQRVIGHSLISFWDSENSESLVGNFICDTVRKQTKADIVFINSSNIEPLDIGKITMEDIYKSVPYDNKLVTIKMKGRDIYRLIHESILQRNSIGVLQVSGLRYRYSISSGEKIIVHHVFVGKKPLELDQDYTITTTDYLYSGGDGYHTFTKGIYLKKHKSLKKILVQYIREEGEIIARIDGRIQQWDFQKMFQEGPD